jgi:uncharacterized protein
VTAEQIIGFTLTLLVMVVGVIGAIVPGLPGTPVIFVAAVGHRLYFGNESANFLVLAILFFLMLISFVVDYAAQYLGAKKLGATWKGAVGAVIGGIVGLFFGIIGIIVGPFIGATLLELIGGRTLKPAAKAGWGAVIGLLIGTVGKVSICVVMMILFAINVFYSSS